MAASAASLAPARERMFVELLAPREGRLEFSARLALICAITVLVAEIYQTPDIALTAYVAFFLNREERSTSLLLTVALTVVLSIVIAFVLLIARWIADDAMWRVVSMAVISFALLFLASATKLKPIAGTLALIIGYALDELGLIGVGEEATRALLYAWLLVGIPAGVSVVVNLLVAPSPRRLAEREIARNLELAAALMRSPTPSLRAEFRKSLDEGLAPAIGLVDRIGAEGSAPVEDIAALRQAVGSLAVLMAAIEMAESRDAFAFPLGARRDIAETLEQMAQVFRDGGYPVGATLGGVPSDLKSEARTLYGALEDAIRTFASPLEASTGSQAEKPAGERRGFFASDAFEKPVHVRYALKTTGAAMFCYFLYSLLDWPGIHTCFLTCYIVSQATVAESIEKLLLRIGGCLVGAAVGLLCIVYVMPMLTSIEGLLVTVFAGALLSAYVAAGSERISYAGFQMAFAFFLCVVQGIHPSFDLTSARDRIIGILIGNIVVFLVFTRLWPRSVTERVDSAIGRAIASVRAVALAKSRAEQRTSAISALQGIGAIETDLDLARYEPPSLRPGASWMAPRKQVVEALRRLSECLLLDPADVAHREKLAERLEAASLGQPLKPPASTNAPERLSLAALADADVRHVEDFCSRGSFGVSRALP